eukprot:6189955-Pleurochrysis_carterae.AAC.2
MSQTTPRRKHSADFRMIVLRGLRPGVAPCIGHLTGPAIDELILVVRNNPGLQLRKSQLKAIIGDAGFFASVIDAAGETRFAGGLAAAFLGAELLLTAPLFVGGGDRSPLTTTYAVELVEHSVHTSAPCGSQKNVRLPAYAPRPAAHSLSRASVSDGVSWNPVGRSPFATCSCLASVIPTSVHTADSTATRAAAFASSTEVKMRPFNNEIN